MKYRNYRNEMIKWKKISIHTVGTFSKSNRKTTERGKIDTPRTDLHDSSFSWLGIGTSIWSGWVKLIMWHENQIQLCWYNSYKNIDGHFVGSATKRLGCNDLEEIDLKWIIIYKSNAREYDKMMICI